MSHQPMSRAFAFSLRLPFALALLLASLPIARAAPAYEGRWGDTLGLLPQHARRQHR